MSPAARKGPARPGVGSRVEIRYDTGPDDDAGVVEDPRRVPGRPRHVFVFTSEDVPEVRQGFGAP